MVETENETPVSVLDNKYNLIKTLGSGATSKVKLALEIETNKIYAIKILKPDVPSSISEEEINNLKKINHENIINLIENSRGILANKKGEFKMVDYIVLDYAENGELFDYLFFPSKGFDETIGRYLFNKILNGVEACHIAGVAHRDLKSDNIMVTGDWILKIADFGYSTNLAGKSGNGILSSHYGTSFYMAPEINYRMDYYGTQVDVFSMGVILFSLVTAKLPFNRAVINDRHYRLFYTNQMDEYWKIMAYVIPPVSEEFKDLIQKMLTYNPANRATIEEIRIHPWMNMGMPSDDEVKAEFEERKLKVVPGKIVQKEEEKKRKQQQINQVYRGRENILFPYFISGDVPRECKKYNPGNPYYIQFMGVDAETIINQLSQFFEEENKKYQEMASSTGEEIEQEKLPVVVPHEKNTRYVFTYKIPQEKPEVGNENDTMNVNEPEFEPEFLEIMVELTVADNATYMLEFVKNKGNKWEFVSLYNNLKKFLEEN